MKNVLAKMMPEKFLKVLTDELIQKMACPEYPVQIL